MEWNEYAVEAMKFCNPATVGPPGRTVAALGLASEIGELCGLAQKAGEGKEIPREKWIDEMGDVLWRIAHFAQTRSIELDALPTLQSHFGPPEGTPALLVDRTQWVAGVMNPTAFLWANNRELRVALHRLRLRLLWLADMLGADAEELMQTNLAKLRARHGDGWKPHEQQNRAPAPTAPEILVELVGGSVCSIASSSAVRIGVIDHDVATVEDWTGSLQSMGGRPLAVLPHDHAWTAYLLEQRHEVADMDEGVAGDLHEVLEGLYQAEGGQG